MTDSVVQVSRIDLRERFLLRAAAIPEPARSEIAEKLLNELLHASDARAERGPIVASPLDKDKYYVVPGEDIGFAETAIEVTVGLLALPTNPIPLISSIALLLYRFYRKSIELNGKQALITMTLMAAPKEGWTVADIIRRLPLEPLLDAVAVEQILHELKDMRRRGEAAPVVREFQGRWWTNEVW